ncbi:mannitol dehydrogenase family protein [Oceanicella sp. SM1341]|uniref:mannitol dehydrogenase family protein n=1 Tax=Oceanicella sp. SM1341 TaxID=1548889 RepID=UPI000E4C4E8F|nr:mannitol dehydrogenase family protein [Oceanicella sp. SM1341]
MTRLTTLSGLPDTVGQPGYDRGALRPGIVHFGLGAFHRAHQAVATEEALAAAGGDWGITGVNLRSRDTEERMAPQNGLYTLLVRGPEGTSARVIGCILGVKTARDDAAAVLALLEDPGTRIVSLTVTEKAYGRDAATGGLDLAHPAIAHDLAHPEAPSGVVGFLVEGLARRRAAGLPPFTPLCCDNLPDNGHVLERLVLDFARLRDPGLAEWIAEHVPFPSTMVDRITPAATEATLADAAALTGFEDAAAIETEPFTQWVIEDRFAAGRPAWEAAEGVIFTDDVAPFEKMKLRMLNGSHSLIAYAGALAGLEHVFDVMEDPALAPMVRAHMAAAAATLAPLPGMDYAAYADALALRFSNRAIRHRTLQIAMDGTQKLPQRLTWPALEALRAGQPLESFAFAVAAWMHFAERAVAGDHALDDPRAAEIAACVAAAADGSAEAMVAALSALPGLMPEDLRTEPRWTRACARALARLRSEGPRAAARAATA